MKAFVLVATAVGVMTMPSIVQAQPRATYNACEDLSLQRGSGPGPSTRSHNEFMRDCLAGKIPFTTPPLPKPASQVQVQSFEKCEALSEQRGAGPQVGTRNHNSFMRQCMTGRIR